MPRLPRFFVPARPVSVPKLMQSIGRIYVQYFNAAYLRTGTLADGSTARGTTRAGRAANPSRESRV
jgi:hypothetical protein